MLHALYCFMHLLNMLMVSMHHAKVHEMSTLKHLTFMNVMTML